VPSGEHPNSKKNLKPWKPGESGNPKGRTSVGASVREHMNAMAEAQLTFEELKLIATDTRAPITRQAAAQRLMRMAEHPDVAEFQQYLNGALDLEQLQKAGINTSLIKKAKVREHEGESGRTIEREIELYDRSGEEFDRVFDRTEGRPKQAVDVTGSLGMPTAVRLIFDEVDDDA
jgi:hypothetical protein